MYLLAVGCKEEYAEKKRCEKFNILEKAVEFPFWRNVPSVNAGRQKDRETAERFPLSFPCREVTYFGKNPAENTLFFRSDQLGYEFPRKGGQ